MKTGRGRLRAGNIWRVLPDDRPATAYKLRIGVAERRVIPPAAGSAFSPTLLASFCPFFATPPSGASWGKLQHVDLKRTFTSKSGYIVWSGECFIDLLGTFSNNTRAFGLFPGRYG